MPFITAESEILKILTSFDTAETQVKVITAVYNYP